MRYNLEETLGEQGFSFLENLHSPIFLVHKNGTVRKVNGAGRKLLKIAHLTIQQIEGALQAIVTHQLLGHRAETLRIKTSTQSVKVVSKQVGRSDYILVELVR